MPTNILFNIASIKVLVSIILFFSIKVSAQNLSSAYSFGSHYQDEASAIAEDSKGNIYVIGYWNYIIDFDPGPGTYNYSSGTNEQSMFILKLDSTESFVWAKRISGVNEVDYFLEIDALDNIYIVGKYTGHTDFDPAFGITYYLNPSGNREVFILKLNSNGEFVWAKTSEGSLQAEPTETTMDQYGNLFITGTLRGTCDFDPSQSTALLSSNGNGDDDFFIWKLDSAGNYEWAHSFGNNSDDNAHAVVVDSFGYVYVTGLFRDSIDFDPDSINTFYGVGYDEAFLLKLDSTGAFKTLKTYGGSNAPATGRAVVTDEHGNVFVNISYEGTLSYDSAGAINQVTSPGIENYVIIKYDSSGNLEWKQRYGWQGRTVPQGMVMDNQGNLYTMGNFSSSFVFTPNSGVIFFSNGHNDVFIAKTDPSGIGEWLVTLGGPEDDIGKSLTVSSDHELRAVGYFNDTALINSFGVYSDTLYSEAFRDFFIINCDVNNQIIVSTETSIDLAGDINLFPNPASEYVKVQIEGEFSKFTNYSVLDNLGRIVISNTESGNEFTISTASLKPGYYHLLLNNNSIQAKRRLIIY